FPTSNINGRREAEIGVVIPSVQRHGGDVAEFRADPRVGNEGVRRSTAVAIIVVAIIAAIAITISMTMVITMELLWSRLRDASRAVLLVLRGGVVLRAGGRSRRLDMRRARQQRVLHVALRKYVRYGSAYIKQH